MRESREDLEMPRLVVPYVADGLMTLANHDLFLFDDRLVALKTPGAMRDAVNDERNRKKDEQKRNAVGEQNRENAGQRQRTQTEQRVAATRASAASLKSSESSDRIVIQLLADVLSAKLSKRAWGVVVLRLQLTDGTKRSWRWMNNSQACRYTEAAPVLRDVLGSLLRE